jgi:hypothetical protein
MTRCSGSASNLSRLAILRVQPIIVAVPIISIAVLALFAFFTVIASALTPATSSPTIFDLDSTRSTYPFVMRLQGTMELRSDSIVILVRSVVIRSAIPIHLGEQGVGRDIRIVFGLGEKTTQGWRMTRDSAPQSVAASLSPGETRTLGPLRLVIDGISGIPLHDRWLAASLGVMQRLPGMQPGLLSSYACAEDNLLGVTNSSRERAEMMRGAYSRTC